MGSNPKFEKPRKEWRCEGKCAGRTYVDAHNETVGSVSIETDTWAAAIVIIVFLVISCYLSFMGKTI